MMTDGWRRRRTTLRQARSKDSSHVEIMRIGTKWGGVAEKDIVEAIQSGSSLLHRLRSCQRRLLPMAICRRELESCASTWSPMPQTFENLDAPLVVDWSYRSFTISSSTTFSFQVDLSGGLPFNHSLERPSFDLKRCVSCEYAAVYALFAVSLSCVLAARCRPLPVLIFLSTVHNTLENVIMYPKVACRRARGKLNTGWDVDGKPLENPSEYSSGIGSLWIAKTLRISSSQLPAPYNTPESARLFRIFSRKVRILFGNLYDRVKEVRRDPATSSNGDACNVETSQKKQEIRAWHQVLVEQSVGDTVLRYSDFVS